MILSKSDGLSNGYVCNTVQGWCRGKSSGGGGGSCVPESVFRFPKVPRLLHRAKSSLAKMGEEQQRSNSSLEMDSDLSESHPQFCQAVRDFLAFLRAAQVRTVIF